MANPDAAGLGEIGADTIPTAQLTYPFLSQAVVEKALPAIVVPQLFTRLPTGGRQTVTIPKEGGSYTAVASRVGPGDQIPLDIAPISGQNITVYKIGRGHVVLREEVMFQQFPLIQQRLRRLGFVMGNTVNTDSMSTLDAGRNSANDVDAITAGADANKSLGVNGTEFARAGTVGQYGILTAKKNAQMLNLDPDVYLTNPSALADLSRLPMFSAQMLYGQPAFQTGERGIFEGLRVLVSASVKGGSGAVGSSYVIASGVTNASLGQYVPMGYMAEALPITSTMRDAVNRDGYEVYSIAMYAPAVVLGDAISRIAYNATAQ